MNEPSQKSRVLSWLTYGPLCGTTLLEALIPRGAARIADLRADGWRIETRECVNRNHSHRTRQVEYVLSGSPGYMSPEMAANATPSTLF